MVGQSFTPKVLVGIASSGPDKVLDMVGFTWKGGGGGADMGGLILSVTFQTLLLSGLLLALEEISFKKGQRSKINNSHHKT